MSADRELVKLLGERFIQRKDVKSFQQADGAWYPERSPMTMQDFEDHFSGKKTMGHYLLDLDGNCKLFAYDIDLVKHDRNCSNKECKGCTVRFKNLALDEKGYPQECGDPFEVNPRAWWMAYDQMPDDLRRSLTISLRCIAEGMAYRVNKRLGIPVAIADSGGKGLHVYGFTGSMPASAVREIALGFLTEMEGIYEAFRGQNFWRHVFEYPMLDIEVFPKQASLDGKELGNLMKLPLGIHRVTGRRSYFIDTRGSIDRLVEKNPLEVLAGDLPWE